VRDQKMDLNGNVGMKNGKKSKRNRFLAGKKEKGMNWKWNFGLEGRNGRLRGD
jgi:hypothetical protein